jgi:hypothetical protein
MLITIEQRSAMNDILNKIENQKVLAQFKDQDVNLMDKIIKEAQNFYFNNYKAKMDYCTTYLLHFKLFSNKPSWLFYTLESNAYTSDDKLRHIDSQINSNFE